MKTSETRGIPAHEGNVPGSSLKQPPLCVISHFHRAAQMSNDELGPSGVLVSKALSSSDVNNLEWLHVLKKRVVLLTEVRVCQLYSFLDAQPHLLPSGKDCSHFPMVFTNRYHGHVCTWPWCWPCILCSHPHYHLLWSWVDKLWVELFFFDRLCFSYTAFIEKQRLSL